jgi:hypothetical protein
MSNLNLLFLGQLSSGLAFELFHSSLAYYILNVTGSSLKFSLAHSLDNLAKLLMLQLAGFLVDKLDRKKVFVWIDIFQSLYLFFVFYFLSSNVVSIESLLMFSFFFGIFRAFTYPSTKAIVPMLVKDGNNRLKASSFEISNDKIARTLSPSISILLFAKFGIKIAVIFTSVLFLVSALFKNNLLVYKDENVSVVKMPVKEYILDGFRALFKSKAIILAWINSLITQLVFHPFLTNVIPNAIRRSTINFPKVEGFFSKIIVFLGGDSSDLYMSLCAGLGIASTIGVIASLLWFQKNRNNMLVHNGMMRMTQFLLLPASLSVVTIYFASNPFTLFMAFFVINTIFYFAINSYTIYFTAFYQSEIDKKSMGRFVANAVSIFMASKSLGHLMYGYMMEYNFMSSLILLIPACLIKIYILNRFKNNLNNKNKNLEVR